MRIDSFTIFLIVLIVFVTIILLTNFFIQHKSCIGVESFVDFNKDGKAGEAIYIPQYSDTDTKSVLSLYDNIYYDFKNGNLIEALSSDSGKTDTIGSSIKSINIVTRDGLAVKNITSQMPNEDGSIPPYSSSESLVKTVTPLYNQFSYKTSTDTTDNYQAFYISWNKNTYIHLVNLNGKDSDGKNAGMNLKTFSFDESGLNNTSSSYNIPYLPDYTSATNQISISSGYANNQKYLNGKNIIVEIAKCFYKKDTSTDSDSSSKYDQKILYFDPVYGNIIIDNGTNLTVYNRKENGKQMTDKYDSIAFSNIPSTNVFIIDDMYPVAAVIVITENSNTIISVIRPNAENKYTLLTSVRFNKNGLVNDMTSDTDTDTKAKTKTTKNDWKDNSNDLNQPPKLDIAYESKNKYSDVCGDDLSCKWYWYFNTIDKKSKDNLLSDDYFLKTEVVPPVCPQCPMCPDSGICANCGGNGGAGICNVTTNQKLAPSPTVPGTFVDSSGNVFVLYTDSNGNKSYIPISRMKPDNFIPASTTSSTGTNSFNPNTIGGALSTTVTGAEKLGTSAINTTGSVANKLVDAAGNVVDTAGNIVNKTIGTASNLVSGTIGTAADLAKGVGSGIMQLGSGNRNNVGNNIGTRVGTNVGNNIGTNVGTSVGTSVGSPISDKTFGNIPGQTSVDNYSYYGALQSKGSSYMPVTADFSSFRK